MWENGKPFITTEHKWDRSWRAKKKAYYNTHKKGQEEYAASVKRGKMKKKDKAKKEPTKAKQITDLKRQLVALE